MNTNHHDDGQRREENMDKSKVVKDSINPITIQFNHEGVKHVTAQPDSQEKASEELTANTTIYSYRTNEFAVKGLDIPPENKEILDRALEIQTNSSIFSTETLTVPVKDKNTFVFESEPAVNHSSKQKKQKVSTPTSKGSQRKHTRHDDDFKKKFANLISKKGITPSFAAEVLGIPRQTAYRWSKKEVTSSELRDNSEGSNEQPKYKSEATELSPAPKNKHGHHRHNEKIKLGFIKLLKKMSASKAADALGVPRRTAHHWKIKYLGPKNNDDLEISDQEERSLSS